LPKDEVRAPRERGCSFARADRNSGGWRRATRRAIKTLEGEKADLQAEKADQAAKHEQDYKELWGLYNEGLDENM
jgi:hypothetical protein